MQKVLLSLGIILELWVKCGAVGIEDRSNIDCQPPLINRGMVDLWYCRLIQMRCNGQLMGQRIERMSQWLERMGQRIERIDVAEGQLSVDSNELQPSILET